MPRLTSLFLVLSLTITTTINASTIAPPQDEQEYKKWALQIWDSLDRQSGVIKLPNGVATLTVPNEFYYLNPEDTEKVLVDVWGNPPAQKNLGMLFPQDMTPFDGDSWGVTIDYEEDGLC